MVVLEFQRYEKNTIELSLKIESSWWKKMFRQFEYNLNKNDGWKLNEKCKHRRNNEVIFRLAYLHVLFVVPPTVPFLVDEASMLSVQR